MSHVDGPEQRDAYYVEIFMADVGAPRVPPRHTILIESTGYPLSLWLDVHFTDDGSTEITSIDIYADEAMKSLLVDGVTLKSFSAEAQTNIHHALHRAICAKTDRAAFHRYVDAIQAALR